jgi:hypothetical protein
MAEMSFLWVGWPRGPIDVVVVKGILVRGETGCRDG